MSKENSLLNAAIKAKKKSNSLDEHFEVILELRKKDFSWREVSSFFKDNGIDVEHTKLSRIAKANHLETNLSKEIPSSEEYLKAIDKIDVSDEVLTMLNCHFFARNRTVTYKVLSESIGKSDYRVANNLYGKFCKDLCAEIGFKPFSNKSGRVFYGSVVGMEYLYADPNDEFQLVMHHELSKALAQLDYIK